MTRMRDIEPDSAQNTATNHTNFFRQELAFDGLTMSVCMQCSTLIAVSEDLSAIASAERRHDQGRHQS